MMLPVQEGDPDRIADYRILGRLGEGGMGVVYLARSPRGRMVAVKTVRAELAAVPEFRRRFAAESAVAQKVGGTWAAAVLDSDPQAALPWVATAYIAGPTLHQVVAEQYGPLPPHSVRGLASGLCRALGDIHGAGLIHRDLKPSNVMVTIDGPKVIDFGVAQALDVSGVERLTRTGMVVGSPGFMSPEQIRGERLTAASDVFSLGAVLAFATTGRSPFDVTAGQPDALLYRVVHEPPDLAGVPEQLRGLVEDCLAKVPADRPTLAALREREETQYHSLGPWLPPEVLAQLGQDAVHLLDHEDPHTRSSHGVTAQATSARRSPTAVLTARPDVGAGGSLPRLVDQRRHARGRQAPADGWRAGLYWLLPLVALTSLLTVIHQLVSIPAPGRRYSDPLPTAESLWWDMFEVKDLTQVLWDTQVFLGVALLVCWLVWSARVRATAESFAPGRLRYRPAMAVLGWFLPIAGFFVPKQIANDVWHASSPPGVRPAPTWALNTWWALWIPTFLSWPLFWTPWTGFLDERFPSSSGPNWTYYVTYEVQPAFWFGLGAHVLVVFTCGSAAFYVRQLSALQAAPR